MFNIQLIRSLLQHVLAVVSRISVDNTAHAAVVSKCVVHRVHYLFKIQLIYDDLKVLQLGINKQCIVVGLQYLYKCLYRHLCCFGSFIAKRSDIPIFYVNCSLVPNRSTVAR